MIGLIFTLVKQVKKLAFVIFLGALGVGGYAHRDDPVVRQLLGLAEKEAEANGIDVARVETEAKQAVATIASGVEKVAAAKLADDRPGTFEVAIAAVRVDPDEFRAGRSADLDVRVVRHPKEGRDKVVFEAHATARANKDSDGLLELSWADRPFRIDWAPGDDFTIEVRDRKLLGLDQSTWFALDLDGRAHFPLGSKTYRLKDRADGKPTADPSANAIVLKSQRLEDKDEDVERAESVSEGRHARPSRR